MELRPGQKACKPYYFDAAGIMAYSRAAGDLNPLHLDPDAARLSRFGALIASGAQMSGVLMGFAATMLSQQGEAIGLEFTFSFLKAIPAGTETILVWTVTDVVPGTISGRFTVTCTGEIVGSDGTRHVSASGKAMVADKRAVTE